MIIVSIYDRVSQEFGPLGVVANESVACRNFRNTMLKLVEDPTVREDYQLYCLGKFDIGYGITEVMKKVVDEGSNYLPKAVG